MVGDVGFNDRILGGLVLVGSLVGVVAYFYLVFISPTALLVIQLSAFAAVGCVLVIVAWIGYTLATTPPPEAFDASLEESGEVEPEVRTLSFVGFAEGMFDG